MRESIAEHDEGISWEQEPTKHQYDWDAATTMGFLNQYGLSDEFKLNVECNHATLAGHSCDHELQVLQPCEMPTVSS